jgi:hypothetical protein
VEQEREVQPVPKGLPKTIESIDALRETLRVLSARLQASPPVPEGCVVSWWHAATKRFRTGEYCSAWHEQEFQRKRKRRPCCVMHCHDGFGELLASERATAGGWAPRESDYTGVSYISIADLL